MVKSFPPPLVTGTSPKEVCNCLAVFNLILPLLQKKNKITTFDCLSFHKSSHYLPQIGTSGN